jgi:DNA/RNA-binding domain of Phe-tRNA-synthetase-like protein/drug/metabolite transporter (DMT)-like permease
MRRLALGVVAMTLVGSSVGVSRTLIHAPLFTAQAIRYAVAAVILLGAASARAGRWGARPGADGFAPAAIVRPRGREWLWLAGIAATGLVLFNVAIVRGVAHAEPAVIAVAVACVPVLLGIIGPLQERQRPSRRILLAALVVTAGSVLVVGTGRTDAAGVGWAAVALACEAGFTLLAVPVLPRHGAWGVSVHSVWLGAAMLVVLGAVTDGPGAVTRLTGADWAAMGYLAVLVTAVAFILWYGTVAALGAGRAGLLTGIAPVAAAVTGILGGSQAPRPLVWLGILVVVCGLAAGLWTRPARVDLVTAGGRPGSDPGRSAAPAGEPDVGGSGGVMSTSSQAGTGGGAAEMFGYDEAVTAQYPQVRAGVIHATRLSNGPSPSDLLAECQAGQQAAAARLAATPIADLPSVAAWRRAFTRFGAKPTQYRNAAEALLRRLAKTGGIPALSTLVDIGNLVSIRYAMPVAVIDQAGVAGRITVRFAAGTEQFTDLGSSASVTPDAGEVIFTDEDNVVAARRWCWRQSAQSATTAATTGALVVIEGQHHTAAADIAAAVGDLTALLARYQPRAHLTSSQL